MQKVHLYHTGDKMAQFTICANVQSLAQSFLNNMAWTFFLVSANKLVSLL